jgi:hypothetical protein
MLSRDAAGNLQAVGGEIVSRHYGLTYQQFEVGRLPAERVGQLPIGAPAQLGDIRGSKPVAPGGGRVTWRSMYFVTQRPSVVPSRWSSA